MPKTNASIAAKKASAERFYVRRKAKLGSYDKDAIVADWRTGRYTIRQLADIHNVSRGMVGPLVKGVEKDLTSCVTEIADSNQFLRTRTDKERLSVTQAVIQEDTKRIQAEKIERFLDKALGVAANKGVEILNSKNATMNDVVGFGKFQNDARTGLGLQPKFSGSATVNIQNNQNGGVESSDIIDAIKRKHAL